jgi:hypothetical protein
VWRPITSIILHQNNQTNQNKPNKEMYTHTQTKSNASKIKSVIDRIANASCDVAKDGKAYRVSDDAINSNVFNAVRDMVEAGCKPSTITAQDIA